MPTITCVIHLISGIFDTYVLVQLPSGLMSWSCWTTWASLSPGRATTHTKRTANAMKNFILDFLIFVLFLDVNERISKNDLMIDASKCWLFIQKWSQKNSTLLRSTGYNTHTHTNCVSIQEMTFCMFFFFSSEHHHVSHLANVQNDICIFGFRFYHRLWMDWDGMCCIQMSYALKKKMTLSYTYTQIDGVKHRRIYPYSILIKSYSIPTLIRSSTWGHRNVEFALVFIRRFKCRFDVEPTTEKSTASYFLFLFCPFGQT